jgi:hypothetical protein
MIEHSDNSRPRSQRERENADKIMLIFEIREIFPLSKVKSVAFVALKTSLTAQKRFTNTPISRQEKNQEKKSPFLRKRNRL